MSLRQPDQCPVCNLGPGDCYCPQTVQLSARAVGIVRHYANLCRRDLEKLGVQVTERQLIKTIRDEALWLTVSKEE